MAEAKLNREYALRIIGVGALMMGICVWSIYDGTKGWPQKNTAMDKARPLLLATNLTATAWLERDDDGTSVLDRLFAEANAKTPGKLVRKISDLKLPANLANDTDSLNAHAARLNTMFQDPVYSEGDLKGQFTMALITALLGLLAFVAVGLKAPKRFVADERGLSGSGFGPRPIAYDDIAEINWAKWDEKGIVRLTLKSGGNVRLDGWHFSGMTGVMDEIRKQRPELAAGEIKNYK